MDVAVLNELLEDEFSRAFEVKDPKGVRNTVLILTDSLARQRAASDQRFDDMNQRFDDSNKCQGVLQWTMTIMFTLLAPLTSAYQFLK